MTTRPFFFFAGAARALLALGAWLLSVPGALELPIAADPLAWHRHEMLFGFAGAVSRSFSSPPARTGPGGCRSPECRLLPWLSCGSRDAWRPCSRA